MFHNLSAIALLIWIGIVSRLIADEYLCFRRSPSFEISEPPRVLLIVECKNWLT
ncbi:MAG: hypothetical protein AAGA75_14610 [Cyanobacteria bacterium P01_E01_bin.6]